MISNDGNAGDDGIDNDNNIIDDGVRRPLSPNQMSLQHEEDTVIGALVWSDEDTNNDKNNDDEVFKKQAQPITSMPTLTRPRSDATISKNGSNTTTTAADGRDHQQQQQQQQQQRPQPKTDPHDENSPPAPRRRRPQRYNQWQKQQQQKPSFGSSDSNAVIDRFWQQQKPTMRAVPRESAAPSVRDLMRQLSHITEALREQYLIQCIRAFMQKTAMLLAYLDSVFAHRKHERAQVVVDDAHSATTASVKHRLLSVSSTSSFRSLVESANIWPSETGSWMVRSRGSAGSDSTNISAASTTAARLSSRHRRHANPLLNRLMSGASPSAPRKKELQPRRTEEGLLHAHYSYDPKRLTRLRAKMMADLNIPSNADLFIYLSTAEKFYPGLYVALFGHPRVEQKIIDSLF